MYLQAIELRLSIASSNCFVSLSFVLGILCQNDALLYVNSGQTSLTNAISYSSTFLITSPRHLSSCFTSGGQLSYLDVAAFYSSGIILAPLLSFLETSSLFNSQHVTSFLHPHPSTPLSKGPLNSVYRSASKVTPDTLTIWRLSSFDALARSF
jgi:hypothetical protein